MSELRMSQRIKNKSSLPAVKSKNITVAQPGLVKNRKQKSTKKTRDTSPSTTPSSSSATISMATSSENSNQINSASNGTSLLTSPLFKIAETEVEIMERLKAETAGLTPQLATLAQAIVSALMSSTDRKIAEERKRHEAEVCALKEKIQMLSDKNVFYFYPRI